MHPESPERIEERMKQRRQALAGKMDALEGEVGGAVRDTTHAIRDAANTVQHAVAGTSDILHRQMAALGDGATDVVRQVLDVGEVAKERPWTAVGCSAVAGLAVGLFAFGRGSAPAPRSLSAASSPRSMGSGLFGGFLDKIQTEIRRIGEDAIETASRSVRQAVQENVPKLVDGAAARLVDMEENYSPQNGSHRAYAR